eukprot:jgi/Mesen1/6984/ME000364S06161
MVGINEIGQETTRDPQFNSHKKVADVESEKRSALVSSGLQSGNGEEERREKTLAVTSRGSSIEISESQPEWEIDLRSRQDLEYAPDIIQYLLSRSESAEAWKWDHVTLKEALVGRGMMDTVRFYMHQDKPALTSVWTLGKDMVGHPKIVHGGAIAFAFDESFGILFASLNLGPGFTANLNVDYRKPFPAQHAGCLVAEVDTRDRRKVFLKAVLRDGPEGVLYAEAKALFIVAKKD